MDNGRPFGDPGSDIIPVIALWLVGLGIDVLRNRPCQPRDNAKVERMQGVTASWAEPARCADAQILQEHLDQAIHIQRSKYQCRRLGGHTRAEVYPDLFSGGSPYAGEAFDLRRVFCFLAQGTWVRKVSGEGQVAFYNQRWQVGRAYRRQHVNIRLEAESWRWIVSDEQGHEIKRFDSGFIAAAIERLSLRQRTNDG
ncbi:MAG TPA: hypothetical protein VFG50_10510 [Rhodothermales bacterium]|nr:hypothetical protein [Rhodothermales bacterium]